MMDTDRGIDREYGNKKKRYFGCKKPRRGDFEFEWFVFQSCFQLPLRRNDAFRVRANVEKRRISRFGLFACRRPCYRPEDSARTCKQYVYPHHTRVSAPRTTVRVVVGFFFVALTLGFFSVFDGIRDDGGRRVTGRPGNGAHNRRCAHRRWRTTTAGGRVACVREFTTRSRKTSVTCGGGGALRFPVSRAQHYTCCGQRAGGASKRTRDGRKEQK